MMKMIKILLVGTAAFVVLDAALFDGHYLTVVVMHAKEFWYDLNHLDWMASR